MYKTQSEKKNITGDRKKQPLSGAVIARSNAYAKTHDSDNK